MKWWWFLQFPRPTFDVPLSLPTPAHEFGMRHWPEKGREAPQITENVPLMGCTGRLSLIYPRQRHSCGINDSEWVCWGGEAGAWCRLSPSHTHKPSSSCSLRKYQRGSRDVHLPSLQLSPPTIGNNGHRLPLIGDSFCLANNGAHDLQDERAKAGQWRSRVSKL